MGRSEGEGGREGRRGEGGGAVGTPGRAGTVMKSQLPLSRKDGTVVFRFWSWPCH